MAHFLQYISLEVNSFIITVQGEIGNLFEKYIATACVFCIKLGSTGFIASYDGTRHWEIGWPHFAVNCS